ncbi:hypothetical protein SAMN04488543_1931 [Friedmanniella luteola]|uniref:Integral membrane protein n=1 Tax=Friedmanniella luteola TaxID=546871 RepID=A0A1H1T2F4_9ACTN|nr:hypothetical protein [Friedmanniella luteola]SDS54328.1 hypothetical protein SAMN04488543_1931 [Friedmanniella luteola]
MTLTYRSLASVLLITATVMSAAFQLYRASLGTAEEVDRFGPDAAVAYGCFIVVAVVVRGDRTWAWTATALLLVAVLVYGVTVYYPTVHAARPMGLLDWVEGTLYTGLLLAALGCALLRLTGTTVAPSRSGVTSARGSALDAAGEAASQPASTRPV